VYVVSSYVAYVVARRLEVLETAVKSLATVPFGDFALCSTRHFYLAPTLLPTPNREAVYGCRMFKGPIDAEHNN
jgi:hypothetical protein